MNLEKNAGDGLPCTRKAPHNGELFRLAAVLAAAVLLVGEMAVRLLRGLLNVLVVRDLLFLAHDYHLS